MNKNYFSKVFALRILDLSSSTSLAPQTSPVLSVVSYICSSMVMEERCLASLCTIPLHMLEMTINPLDFTRHQRICQDGYCVKQYLCFETFQTFTHL